MLDIFAGFDILGLGTLLGSLLFLAGLIWVLVDDRSFDEVNRRHAARAEAARAEVEVRAPAPREAAAVVAPTTPATTPAPAGGSFHRGLRARRRPPAPASGIEAAASGIEEVADSVRAAR